MLHLDGAVQGDLGGEEPSVHKVEEALRPARAPRLREHLNAQLALGRIAAHGDHVTQQPCVRASYLRACSAQVAPMKVNI